MTTVNSPEEDKEKKDRVDNEEELDYDMKTEKRETPAKFLMEELDKDLTRFELKKRRMKVKREIRDIRKRARERIVKVKEKAGYISDSEEEDQLEDNGNIDIMTETPKVKKEPDTRNVEVETGNNREFEENIRKNETYMDETGQERFEDPAQRADPEHIQLKKLDRASISEDHEIIDRDSGDK